MPDEETLDRRLRAVERSITDGDHDVDELRDVGALVERVQSLESQLDDAEGRIADLEAATQALRGYVGNVRSVNEDVERRADAALAAVDRLEKRRDEGTRSSRADSPSPVRRPAMEHSRTSRGEPRGRERPTATDTDSSEGSDGSSGTVGSTGSDTTSLVQRVRDVL